MKRFIALVAVLVMLLSAGCESRLEHSQTDAANVASTYLTKLLIDQDSEAAYAMRDSESNEDVTAADLKRWASMQAGAGDVTQIKATEYEISQDKAAIEVYLTGYGESQVRYYRVRVRGTAAMGYQPSETEVSGEPFPGSNFRQRLY